jgi:hypothetical protein
MKGIEKSIIDGVTLADGALTDANATAFDFSSYPLAREFVLSGKLVPNTTSPGADKHLALNWYWSDYDILNGYGALATYVPLLLANRKYTTGPIRLTNETLANNGEMHVRFRPAEALSVLTTTASTTTATLTFPPGYNPRLNVGDLVTVAGGGITGDGAQMRGTYPLAAVTHSSGSNGQIVTTATYTITSTTGTLVGASVFVERAARRGGNESPALDIMRPMARFLYVTVDRAALTSNATTKLTVNVVRVPSAARDL